MDCAFNYVVTAHKPTNVTHSTVGHFTSAQDINLIISCVDPIHRKLTWSCPSTKAKLFDACEHCAQEVHSHRNTQAHPRWPAGAAELCIKSLFPRMLPEKLCTYVLTALDPQGVADVPLYGRIATLELFRPPVSPAAARADHRLVKEATHLHCCSQSARWKRKFWPAVAQHGKTKVFGKTQAAQPDSTCAGRGEGPALHLDGALQVLRAGVGQQHRRAPSERLAAAG